MGGTVYKPLTPEQRERKRTTDRARSSRLWREDPEYREAQKARERKAYVRKHGERPEGKRYRNRPSGISPWLIPEDGIVDDIAVEVAVSGARRVRLTPTEHCLAVEQMVRQGSSIKEIARHIGMADINVKDLIRRIGEGIREVEATREATRQTIAS